MVWVPNLRPELIFKTSLESGNLEVLRWHLGDTGTCVITLGVLGATSATAQAIGW
jgi:hypothetical protein